MIASTRAAPNTEPITIAAISPPERPSDCDSGSPAVTFVVMVTVAMDVMTLDDDGATVISKAT